MLRGSAVREIVSYLKQRGVEHLVHFTPVSNLEGIRRLGIVPRLELEQCGDSEFKALDGMRLDSGKHMSCFSLSFPNYQMMYRYRKRLQEDGDDIAVLFIRIGCLDRLSMDQVLFYPSNAASHECREMDECDLMGIEAVCRMFDERGETRRGHEFSRKDLGLPTYLTTDPQAEVQIAATIPWSDVCFVVVKGFEKRDELRRLGSYGSVYGKWDVKREKSLSVFSYPECWSIWVEKG